MASGSSVGPILGMYKSKKLGVASVLIGFGLVAAGENMGNSIVFIVGCAMATLSGSAYIIGQAISEAFGQRVEEEAATPSAPATTSSAKP